MDVILKYLQSMSIFLVKFREKTTPTRLNKTTFPNNIVVLLFLESTSQKSISSPSYLGCSFAIIRICSLVRLNIFSHRSVFYLVHRLSCL